MKLGIISDVHSNQEALKAVLKDLEEEGVERIINCGDHVGYSAFPDECIALMRGKKVESVRGNYDEAVSLGRLECGCGYTDPEVARIGRLSLLWTQEQTGRETKDYLAGLPQHITFDSTAGKVLAMHGGLEDLTQWITEKDEEVLMDISRTTGARLVLLGHTHVPFITQIGETRFVNPGAVGRPFDGDPKASFAIINITNEITVRLIRVAYDVEKNIQDLIRAGLPAEIGLMLRSGRDSHLA